MASTMLAIRLGTKDGYVYIMNGEAVEEDDRSAGQFSNNYIWEETVGDAICRNVFARLHKRCVGCHLCVLVCPTDSIRSSGRRIYRNSS